MPTRIPPPTAHSWTPFALQEAKHRIIQTDLSRWDYKHQVLESAHVPNWRVLVWVKLIETICQLRPKSLMRHLFHPDPLFRAGMRWYSNIGRRVWCHEICQWLFFDRRVSHGPTVGEFLKGGWRMGRIGHDGCKHQAASQPKMRLSWPVFGGLHSWPVGAKLMKFDKMKARSSQPQTPILNALQS